MGKSTFFTGQPILNQVLLLIPKPEINKVVLKHNTDRYYKKFFFYDHLVTMLFSTFHKCTSLREVITGMQAQSTRLMHLGLKNTPRRSTFAESNAKRTSSAFEELFHSLVAYYIKKSPDSRSRNGLRRMFIIDSTTMTLFKNIMKSAGNEKANGKKKGGAKAHMVLDADRNTPVFVRITESRMSDKTFLNYVNLPPNSTVVMDKGYNQYRTYLHWSKNNINWYTRLNKAAVFEIRDEMPVSKEQAELGVHEDLLIKLGNPTTKKRAPLQDARLVKYKDKLTGREFEFLTNDFDSTPYEVAGMYRKRWPIETFFRSFKQNFTLQYFLGDNENAIKIQIWCSLIANLLTQVIMDITAANKKKWAFSNLCAFIRLHLETYIDLFAFLKNPEKALLNYKPPNVQMQMKLL